MPGPRYLTKSLFALALECETKLYYTKKPKEYPDQKIDDPFLDSLAEGGFQVGELALETHEGAADLPAAAASRGPPANVAMAYARLAADIRNGVFTVPDFRDASRLSRLLAAIDQAATAGRTTVGH